MYLRSGFVVLVIATALPVTFSSPALGQTCAANRLSPNYDSGAARPWQAANVPSMTFFWGSNVGGGPTIPSQVKASSAAAAGPWNACNQDDDDYPYISRTGWTPRGFSSNNTVYRMAMRYVNTTDSTTCAAWHQPSNRMFVYPLKKVGGVTYWCPTQIYLNDLAVGNDPAVTGSESWFQNMLTHEFGHPLGLDDQTFSQTGCAMSGDELVTLPASHPYYPNLKVARKTSGGPSANEKEEADKVNSTNGELEDECAANPANCTPVTPPPPGGPGPGPETDGPLRCGEGAGPGGFPGCETPDLDRAIGGSNPVYIEIYRQNNSGTTTICYEI